VYKAMDKETGGIVAIKLIPICEEGNEDELKKIIREINLLQQCDSSYVTAYYGSYFKDKRLWVRPRSSSWMKQVLTLRVGYENQIVMEYCSGGSLKRVMTRLKSPLTEEEISVVCYQVLCSCTPTTELLEKYQSLSVWRENRWPRALPTSTVGASFTATSKRVTHTFLFRAIPLLTPLRSSLPQRQHFAPFKRPCQAR